MADEERADGADGAVRWLDAEEDRTWRDLLTMTQLLQVSLDRQMRTEAGMPQTYYTVLAMLSEAPGRRLRMSRLAEITTSSPSRIVTMPDAAEVAEAKPAPA